MERLHFRPTDLSSLELETFSAVTRIVHCALTDCRLSPAQINQINTDIIQAGGVRLATKSIIILLRFFPCSPPVIMTQRKARNAPSRGLWVHDLCLYGMGALA